MLADTPFKDISDAATSSKKQVLAGLGSKEGRKAAGSCEEGGQRSASIHEMASSCQKSKEEDDLEAEIEDFTAAGETYFKEVKKEESCENESVGGYNNGLLSAAKRSPDEIGVYDDGLLSGAKRSPDGIGNFHESDEFEYIKLGALLKIILVLVVKLQEFPFQNIKMVVLEEEEEEQEGFISKWDYNKLYFEWNLYCSIFPDEDESAVDKFLKMISNLRLSCPVLRRGGAYSSFAIYHLVISILKPVIEYRRIQNFYKPVGEVDVRFAIRDDSLETMVMLSFLLQKK
ncbi:hypothetical protein BUALT_Bualt02G0085300 [Buddleja alternifolia]|uniref:Uncharacterized protein n=1 Tax=Buddleja alternifolia TaxID=168488 RepID=A0AAV6Y5K4_9LAMI|nr:hypothetical protein BUALT_Bualt02G0085300 [Buddleja alternifolia]